MMRWLPLLWGWCVEAAHHHTIDLARPEDLEAALVAREATAGRLEVAWTATLGAYADAAPGVDAFLAPRALE